MGHDLLIRRAIKKRGGQRVHHIEPTTRLSGVLHNEVGRRVGFKPFLVLEWVVLLRKRHRAGLKPAIQHVWHAAHHRLTGRIIRVRAHQLVDVWTVQRLRTDTEIALQLVQGAVDIHARIVVIIGHPHWDRCTPVAGTGDIPVARSLEPLAKLAIPDMLRQPLNLLVVKLHHAIAELGHLHEPSRQRHVDKRLPRAPRVRIGVLDGDVAHHSPSSLQILNDVLIRIKDQLAFIRRNLRGELAVLIHWDNQLDVVLVGGIHIVFTKRRSLVYHTGAVLRGDVISDQNLVGVAQIREEAEDRLISKALELRAGKGLQHLGRP